MLSSSCAVTAAGRDGERRGVVGERQVTVQLLGTVDALGGLGTIGSSLAL